MYLAKKTIDKQTRYIIRETCATEGRLTSRDLFDLGTDPSSFIVYPGGHGYYYEPVIEEALGEKGVFPDPEELDRIFWEFLDPEIRRVIRAFQRTCRRNESPEPVPPDRLHSFDKRRMLYLRCGRIEQGPIDRVPPKFYRSLWNKSRDEIEQYFLSNERVLRSTERALYVYVAFDLQRFFQGPLAKRNPALAEPSKLDEWFMESVCALNEDRSFWAGTPEEEGLREYLRNYVIMYFDSAFAQPSFLQDYVRDFINRHRAYRPPQKVQVKIEEAGRLFGVDWKALTAMDRRTLTQLYRKRALQFHPDQGGAQESFVRLTEMYQALLKRKRSGR